MHKRIDPSHLIWKSEYNIGDLRTDNEHMNLFKIAKKAFELKSDMKPEDEILELKRIIKSLFEYTSTHFKNEERYMYMIAYPDLDRHKDIHKLMLKKLNDFVYKINELNVDEIKDSLCGFIEAYFITHIVDEDKRIEYWNKSLTKMKKHTEWKKNFTVGDELLDEEHRELFEIANEAYIEVSPLERSSKIKIILTKLYNYMKTHFKHEEEYMETIGYPDITEHKKLHSQIIEDVNEFVYKINSIEPTLFEKELATIIDEYIIEHVLRDDRKFYHWKQNQKC